MQTKPESEFGTITGARQVPVLRREDISVGTLFTGIAADHVHRVTAILDNDVMEAERLPRPVVVQPHEHAFSQHGGTGCACGTSRWPIASFLPDDGRTPRIHALVPVGPIVMPDAYSVYVYGSRRTLTVLPRTDAPRPAPTAAPGDEVPIILRAWKAWGLPEACRRLLEQV